MKLTNNERELLENLGFEIIEYSGRGMFGQVTDAIVVDSKATVIELILGENESSETKELIRKVTKAKEDNMGKYDIVIYYKTSYSTLITVDFLF